MVELQVGEFYLSASGEIVKICSIGIEVINYKNTKVFYDIGDNYYEYGGTCVGNIREFDLIAHIPKELHYMITKLINNYHTKENYKKSIKDIFKKENKLGEITK